MRMRSTGAVCAVAIVLAASCGGGAARDDAAPADAAGAPAPAAGELTAAELENGIGPITAVELGALDPALAARGEEIFRTKCYACHRLEEQYVAPQLGNVLERRTPEFVMNMILNPGVMVKRHPVTLALVAQFMVEMPDQNVTEDEARAVLEYIRSNAEGTQASVAQPAVVGVNEPNSRGR